MIGFPNKALSKVDFPKLKGANTAILKLGLFNVEKLNQDHLIILDAVGDLKKHKHF
jgi:hypothetical protein